MAFSYYCIFVSSQQYNNATRYYTHEKMEPPKTIELKLPTVRSPVQPQFIHNTQASTRENESSQHIDLLDLFLSN